MDNGRKYTTLTQAQLDAISDEDLDSLHGNQNRNNTSWFGDGQAPYVVHWIGNKPSFLWGAKSGEDLTFSQIKAKKVDPADELYRPPTEP